jgi:hypothetical protein
LNQEQPTIAEERGKTPRSSEHEFVERIHVFKRDRKGSVETTQKVDIDFNFVGRYVPPHFGEVKLTSAEKR